MGRLRRPGPWWSASADATREGPGLVDRVRSSTSRRRRTHDRARDGTRGAGRRRAAAGPARVARAGPPEAVGRSPAARPGGGAAGAPGRPSRYPRSAAPPGPSRAARRSTSRSPSPARAARSSSTAATAPASRSTPPSRSSPSRPPASRRPTATGSSRSRSPASTRRGVIHDEYATLLDPGRDVGPVFVHGISTSEVRGAPTFAEIAGEILDLMDGAVVVLHDGAFVERFLDAEFARAGVALPLTPALCSQWLARRTLRTPDHTLRTLARHAGRTTLDTTVGARRRPHPGRPAAADAGRARPAGPATSAGCARCRSATSTSRPTDPPGRRPREHRRLDGHAAGPPVAARRRCRARSTPSATSTRSPRRWATAACSAVRPRPWPGSAARPGSAPPRSTALHGRLLEHLRAAALSDAILTTGQIRQLRTAASALGRPTYFDELRPTSPQDLVAARSAPSARLTTTCSHCRRPGHDRSGCPQLAALTV